MATLLKIISDAFFSSNPGYAGIVPSSIVNGLPAALKAGRADVVTLLEEGGLSETLAGVTADAVMAAAVVAA